MGEKRFPRNSCYWSYLSISLLPISHCWIQTCFPLKKKKKVISGLENVPTWKADWLSKARKQAFSHQTKFLDLAHSAVKGNLLSYLGVQEEFSKNIFQALLPSRVIIGLGRRFYWKSQNDSFRIVKLKVNCTQHIPQLLSNKIIQGYSPTVLTPQGQISSPFCYLFTIPKRAQVGIHT